MKRASAAIILASLGGCSSVETPLDDGYQPFDGTKTVLSLQARYCATADPNQRAMLLGTMMALGLKIPPSGACTDPLSLFNPAALVNVDVDRAVEDQKRFQ